MSKSLLYRLFGIGKIPDKLRATLRTEGVLFMEEGLRGSATYRDFRAPGRYSNWRRQWYPASLVLTKERLLALSYSNPIIDIPLRDERLRRLQFTREAGDRLSVAFDPALFHDDWSGTIEYRFRTPEAARFLELLRASLR